MSGSVEREPLTSATARRFDAIVLGASAGAVDAFSVLLPALPPNYPLPLLVVVHLPRDRDSTLPELYRSRCRVEVKEAEDKEPLRAGVVYFAPPDYHLLVEADGRLSLSNEEPVLYSRPSIDVLFESAAEVFEERLLGIVLTGANHDGARGLRAICEAGGTGIVQDPGTARAPAMPLAAQAACPGARSLSLDQIRDFLQSLASKR